MKPILSITAALACGAAFATAVTSLPAPDSDGYYTFGAAYTYSGTTSYGFDGNAPAYPVWSQMSVPAGAKIKLAGGVILDSFPANVSEVDCSGLTFLAIVKSSIAELAGLQLSIPSGAKLCVCSGTVSADGNGDVTWTASNNTAMEIPCHIKLDGKLYWHKNTLTLSGAFSGASTGEIVLSTQMNTHVKFTGAVEFAGNVTGGNSAQQIWASVASGDASFGNVYVVGKNTATGNAFFVFKPEYDDSSRPANVSMTRFDAGAAQLSGGTRQGTVFAICGGRSASIGTLSGGGAHFITANGAVATQSDSVGGASVSVGNVNPSAKASGTKSGTYYLSKNMSYSIDGVGTDMTANQGRTVVFTYAAETSGVNSNSFSIGAVKSGSGAAWQTVRLVAPDPALMPRTVALPPNTGLAGGCDVEITGGAWTFDFDFAAQDPCPSACEISGAKNVTVPAQGTIAVTIPHGAGTPRPVDGVYPLATWSSGGGTLSAQDWPVSINGTVAEELQVRGAKVSVVRSSTGISLAVKVNGLVVIAR